MSDTKKCTTCGVEKPATPEFYHRDKGKKGGLRHDCKECVKLYHEKNKEKKKEYDKLYYENNKEKIKEREKLYRENNKEKKKEYNKLYRENNKEKINEHNKIGRENRKQNNSYGIYKITHKETGKIYIGETINFNERLSKHNSALKHQSHKNHLLQETFNSGGQDFDEIFEFEILEEWDIERKQEFDSEKGKQCPKYKLLKEELKKREAEVIEEYIQQGHDLYNWGIDVETYAALMAEMREYLEARDEQGEEEEEDEIPRMESSRRG
jgi:hypothetical protein